MKKIVQQLTPFILAGIALVALVFGVMLLAYLFFFGAIIGFILFLIAEIREKFFSTKSPAKTQKKQTGRIIDSDDYDKL